MQDKKRFSADESSSLLKYGTANSSLSRSMGMLETTATLKRRQTVKDPPSY